MKMREMRMEKISWVKREMNRTRKLPSRATMRMTMTISHIPTQIRPTMYSMFWDEQNCGRMNGGQRMLMREGWMDEDSKATHAVEGLLKQQQRSGEADHQHRLGSDETEDDPLDAGGDHQLRDAHHLFRFVR